MMKKPYEIVETTRIGLPTRRAVNGLYAPDLAREGGHYIAIEIGSDDASTTERRLAITRLERRGSVPARLSKQPSASDDLVTKMIVEKAVLEAADAAKYESTHLEVLVALRALEMESLSRAMERERLMLPQRFDAQRVRERLIAERFSATKESQASFVATVERQLGGKVLERFGFANVLFVRIPRLNLRELARQAEVVRVQFVGKLRQHSVDGVSVLNAHRVTAYIASGYSGGHPNPSLHGHRAIALAVVDSSFEDEHETIAGRVDERWVCTPDRCVAVDDLESDQFGGNNLFPRRDDRHGGVCAQIAAGNPPGRVCPPS